jgi:hypothetical protein
VRVVVIRRNKTSHTSVFFVPLKSFWFTLLLALLPAAAPAQLTTITNNGQITITGYNGTPPALLVIPSTNNGFPVTAIAPSAFFYGALTSVSIPSTVTNIGDQAFVGDYGLTSINVDPANTFYSSLGGVLFNYSQTRLVAYPISATNTSYVIPSTVTSIGDNAFTGSTLTNVTIPSSVTIIEGGAFTGCVELASVAIPNNVISIGSGAFINDSSLTNASIPASVTNIGDGAFYNCARLTNALFQGNAPTLGAGVFQGDPNLGSFTVTYHVGATGFTTPTWNGYTAVSDGILIPTVAQSIYSQTYTFTTFAGLAGSGSTDGAGNNAEFNYPRGIAVDSAGNVYVADTYNDTIRKVTPAGIVTTLAGLAGSPGSADGTGSAARFNQPFGVALDRWGNVYVADTDNDTIRKITPAGAVTTIAGIPGAEGAVDATGTNARFNQPFGLAVDSSTNIYVADTYNFTIRKISPGGVVSTLAGLAYNSGTNDGTGNAARFYEPTSVAVDGASNVYVADYLNSTIRKVTSAGAVTTLAGLGGVSGTTDATGSAARFYFPNGVALDSATNVYVADSENNRIRVVTPAGVVTTLAGMYGGDVDATGSAAKFSYPASVAVDTAGNVYVADFNSSTVRKVSPVGRVITLAGASGSTGNADGTGDRARFSFPHGVATDTAGNVYVADQYNNTIREITTAGVVYTIAGTTGNYGSADGVGADAAFNYPSGVATDGAANVYVADSYNHTIRKITPAGVVTTIAGLANNYGTNDGTGSAARFGSPDGSPGPTSIALDTGGNIYVADSYNHTIRKATPVGTNWVVSTLAGQPEVPGTNDGTGSAAQFNQPTGVAVDAASNVYVADFYNYTIRKITPGGVVTTIAGQPGTGGKADGIGGAAQFFLPGGVAVDPTGNLFVADTGASTIRKITAAGPVWVVSTIAGKYGALGSKDGAGVNALFSNPYGVAVDGMGKVYVADTANNTIRQGVFTQYAPANPVAFTPPPSTGQLMVTLLPPQANGQWRFPWESAWRNSGTVATGLAQGEYTNIEFRTIPGYLAPALSGPVAVTNGGTVFLTNTYFPTIIPDDTSGGAGSLTVNIGPAAPNGAGWRFLGDTNSFNAPGYSTNLLSGTYLLQFAPVGGFATPASLSVQVAPGLPTVLQITYLLAQSPPNGALLPVPVPPGEINDLTDYPYGYNGQLRTDVGYGSGVAVQTNVVLTAAHLIFNDQALSFVNQAYWFYQEETGVFTPDPLLARGWYVLSGYASQRTNDVLGGLGPDQSSPQSRNLDVAALYFDSPVANGGFGGYLPSDATPNPWLTSTSEKMLVGYPVDGSQFGVNNIINGQMYEIGPQPYTLGLAPDPVADQQIYTAPWMLSFPGNSGGPFYVQLNGYYYPAAVYLGTLFNGTVPYASAVRAIDSNVVSLITLAAALGDTGTNNSGGGVITIIPSLSASVSHPGYLILQLGPPSAVQAGAAWKLTNQSANFYSAANPSLQEVTSTNALVVQFKPIPGWILPTNRAVTVVPGLILTNVATYTVTNPVLTVDPINGLGLSGTSNTTYQIQSNSVLTGTWIPFKTNTLTNFNFNSITNHPRPGFYRALWLTN